MKPFFTVFLQSMLALLVAAGCAPTPVTFRVLDASDQPLAGVNVGLTTKNKGDGWYPMMPDSQARKVESTDSGGLVTVTAGPDDIIQFDKNCYQYRKMRVGDGSVVFLEDSLLQPYRELSRQPLPPSGPLPIHFQAGPDENEVLWRFIAPNLPPKLRNSILRMSDEEFEVEVAHSDSALGALMPPYAKEWIAAMRWARKSHLASSSTSPTPPPMVLVRDANERAAAVGEHVRVEGIVTNTKQPQIAGIDVETTYDTADRKAFDLRGQSAWAEGILIRHVVTPEQVNDFSQNRGAGTFYELIDPSTGETAIAHRSASTNP